MPAEPLSPTWKELLEQYAPLPQEHHVLVAGADFYDTMTRRAGQRDGEVALVVRRPDGLLLLHTKPFYPSETWRMPTGGVERSETLEAAVCRETLEETGLPAGTPQPLGVVTYEIHTPGGRPVRFASAVFLVSVPDLPPAKQDPQEQISGYRWAPPDDFSAIAAQLEHLPPDWGDWGRFRALAHRFVAEALA